MSESKTAKKTFEHARSRMKLRQQVRSYVLVGILLVGGVQLFAADVLYTVTEIYDGVGYTDNLIHVSALNDAGEVTGTTGRAFLYSNGRMIDLGLGGHNSEGTAINNAGQVTGWSTMATGGGRHAFLYSNGQMIDLGTLGGDNSAGFAINDAGQVTGISDTVTGDSHAFLYSNGQMKDLGTLGGRSSRSRAINKLGQVTGYSETVTGDSHAFLYSGGQMIDLGSVPGYPSSDGTALNDAGQVVGVSQTVPGGASHAFLYSNAQMIDLGGGGAAAINNAGQVTGWSYTATGAVQAFLYTNGQMIDLGALPYAPISYGMAINNSGQVTVASYRAFLYSDGHMRDLNDLLTAPGFASIWRNIGINNHGQIFASGYWISLEGGTTYSAAFLLTPVAPPLQFVPVTPCRVADTRNPDAPFGGPKLAGGTSRDFAIANSTCNIPASAAAYSLNVTAVPDAQLGYLTIWPTGQSQPYVSTLNSDGRIKANAAIVPAGTNGAVSVYVTDSTHLVLDIDGYFVPAGSSPSGLAFYPVTPCRIADTRQGTGPLAGPYLGAGTSRSFAIQSSSCSIPSTAQAYSLNFTAAPHGALGYLTVWPSRQLQPFVSTLNAPTGTVVANAAIVPAGSNGDVSVYATDDTDLVIDVNGYFAPPAMNGLSFYTLAPCRVLDTRSSSGLFSGTLGVKVEGSCNSPADAQAFVLNATVVPAEPLDYLTLWPDMQVQPYVSTLNAFDGAITSNLAIVPTFNGSVDAFATNETQLILDLFGYFAP